MIDLNDTALVDSYEIPDRMRENRLLRSLADTFPWGTSLSRSQDIDHTVPYLQPDKGGPPGQTRMDNIAPLGRGHHRVKTFTTFGVRQPCAGVLVWGSPHQRHFLVTAAGTLPLGSTEFARRLWNLAGTMSAENARAAAAAPGD